MNIFKSNKRIISMLLCLTMGMSVLVPAKTGSVYAAEGDALYATEGDASEYIEESDTQEMTEAGTQEVIETDTEEVVENSDAEDYVSAAECVSDEENSEESTASEDSDAPEKDTVADNEAGLVQSELDINFAVIEEAEFKTPAMDKYIVVDMGDESTKIDDATLVILNETTGDEYEIKADKIQDSSMVFYASFPNSSFAGKYVIKKIVYISENTEYVKYCSDSDMLPRFGVNKKIDGEPDAWFVDEETDSASNSSVSDMAEESKEIIDLSDGFDNADAIGVNGSNSDISITNESSKNETQDVEIVNIEESAKELAEKIETAARKKQQGSMTSTSGNIIIVLDPGHGANDPGAVRTWDNIYYCERDINQKIANACKAELSKNTEITVYMTRNSTSDPFHGATSQDLQWRCKYAYEMHADLFVSLHCNSGGPQVNGAEVYVPNKSLNESNYNVGQAVGGAILAKLVELGIANRGLIVKNSASGAKYSDGSIADYYAVIKGCKQYGIPGMIVEHDYISNEEDCKKFFGSDEAIAALGVADAQGILSCLDTLKLNRTGGAADAVEGTWDVVNGYKVYRDANGNLVTGFFSVEDQTYYGDANGYVVTGYQAINGKSYYFGDDGVMLTNVWRTVNSVKYYFTETGVMAKSKWVSIDGKIYYFKSNGKRYKKGWRTIGRKTYYFIKGGSVETNKWKKKGTAKKYLTSDGHVATGWTQIKNSIYYFNKYGNMQYGWVKGGGKKYYLNWKNGKAFKGWHTIWGKKYYFSKEDASLQTGFTKVGKKTYYLFGSGGYQTGWKKMKGKIYFFNNKGVMQTGWTTYGGHKAYLMDETGELAKKTFVVVGKGNYKGSTFYFDKKYKYVTGFRSIKKEKYYFDEDGVMKQSDWITDDNGVTYYARDNGMFSHDRFETIGEHKYYFNSSGQFVTGTQVIAYNGTPYTYEFDASGHLVSGDGPATNYEDDVAAGTVNNSDTDETGMYLIMGTSSVTVEQMVNRYVASGKTYPATDLTPGGADSITTFCTILKEEADAEGVKAEVLYSQVMNETGWLQFGGDV